jgi:hypothetical protein
LTQRDAGAIYGSIVQVLAWAISRILQARQSGGETMTLQANKDKEEHQVWQRIIDRMFLKIESISNQIEKEGGSSQEWVRDLYVDVLRITADVSTSHGFEPKRSLNGVVENIVQYKAVRWYALKNYLDLRFGSHHAWDEPAALVQHLDSLQEVFDFADQDQSVEQMKKFLDSLAVIPKSKMSRLEGAK